MLGFQTIDKDVRTLFALASNLKPVEYLNLEYQWRIHDSKGTQGTCSIQVWVKIAIPSQLLDGRVWGWYRWWNPATPWWKGKGLFGFRERTKSCLANMPITQCHLTKKDSALLSGIKTVLGWWPNRIRIVINPIGSHKLIVQTFSRWSLNVKQKQPGFTVTPTGRTNSFCLFPLHSFWL
jgi:hypothetical protein